MAREHDRKDKAAFPEPARGLQSAGTSDRPTRLEISTAPDVSTTMNLTLRRSRARGKRSSLSLSEGAATGQTPSQTFERRLFQQDERVAHVVRVRLRPRRQHRADGLHQPLRPARGNAEA
jgi:hypothetical protein